MRTTAFLVLLGIYFASFAQVDVSLQVYDRTYEEKGIFYSTITFDVYIDNQSSDTLYYPYNAVGITDAHYHDAGFGMIPESHYLPYRYLFLISQNDTSAFFSRGPIVKQYFINEWRQKKYSRILHLNFYGHPVEHYFTTELNLYENYMDKIQFLSIPVNSKYHIKYNFQFEMPDKPFNSVLSDTSFTNMRIKIVLFKNYFENFVIPLGEKTNPFFDSTFQKQVINKWFEIPEWKTNEPITPIEFQDTGKSIAFIFEQNFYLFWMYFVGGW